MKLCIGKNISKYILSLLGGILAIGALIPASYVVGQFADEPFPYDIQGQEYNPADPANPITTDIASGIIKPDTNESTSLLKRLTDFFRLSGTSYNPSSGTISPATNYVKWILNIMLGLVSFLSLVMIIFAFYLIFFSKGEEAVGKAKKILVGVGIALAIMGLSWFIASFFFDIYTTVTQ